jgi:hypothetical protein
VFILLSDDFSEFMINTVSIYPFSSKNKFGENTYGTAVTSNCILSNNLENIMDKDNKQTIANTKIFVNGNISVAYNSKIVVGSVIGNPKKINEVRDDVGIYCKIIYL